MDRESAQQGAVAFHRAIRVLRALTLPLVIGGLGGCAPVNRDQLVAEVVKADPEFVAVLDKHRELARRIETFQRELALKRSTVERSIERMRKELVDAAQTVKQKTEELASRLEPDRQRIALALSLATEELRVKRLQRASLGRSLAQLKKALTRGGSAWTDKERSRQQAQVDEMLQDAHRLDQELHALKEHVRLLKLKLLLIQL